MTEMPPESLIPQQEKDKIEKFDSPGEDNLTGLPNRASFELSFNLLMKERNESKALAVMFLDLNDFKAVNDTRGHADGDQALRVVGNVLKNEPGIPCRNGGDEFVYAQEVDGHSYIKVLEGIRTRINEALVNAGFPEVTVSIGCAVSEGVDKRSRADLMKEADTEMYADKIKQRASKPVTTKSLGKGLYPGGYMNN